MFLHGNAKPHSFLDKSGDIVLKNDPTTKTLDQVDSRRRGFLRELLTGGAAVAVLPAMTTVAFAQDAGKGKGN